MKDDAVTKKEMARGGIRAYTSQTLSGRTESRNRIQILKSNLLATHSQVSARMNWGLNYLVYFQV
jgi:hypothetical protein